MVVAFAAQKYGIFSYLTICNRIFAYLCSECFDMYVLLLLFWRLLSSEEICSNLREYFRFYLFCSPLERLLTETVGAYEKGKIRVLKLLKYGIFPDGEKRVRRIFAYCNVYYTL